jgi:lipopolysaccharide heptosyltransferase II
MTAGASGNVRKILVIKLRAIGDVLLSTVVLPPLRAAYPNAQIDFLCETPSADVVRGNPSVDEILVFNPKKERGSSLVLRVRKRRYDLVIDLFGNPRSAIVALLSGAHQKVGYRFSWRRFCYTDIVEPRGGAVHNTQFNLDALRRIGIQIPESAAIPHFPLSHESVRTAEKFFLDNGLAGSRCIALNPGGGWYTKRWKREYFADIGSRLWKDFNLKSVIIWGPGERTSAEAMQKTMGTFATMIPETSLKELGAILQHCTCMITNDSGPMHIAAALGVHVVAIFGPTNPSLQGPVGGPSLILRKESLDCLSCNLTECPIENPCMELLGVAEVYDRVAAFLHNHHCIGSDYEAKKHQ